MTGRQLDLYLSKGYFRAQQDLFTCEYVVFENELCPVFWLRILLANVQYGPKQRRLFRINQPFTVRVKSLEITDELEDLYRRYRASIDFDAPETVQQCLLAGPLNTVFETYIVEVRDNGLLIAVGVFDHGYDSIAGIMNFYHPDYHRHSLGKFLMMQKIEFARQQGETYYYPGYLALGYTKFDYKLFPCEAATEVYDSLRDEWLPFSWSTVQNL